MTKRSERIYALRCEHMFIAISGWRCVVMKLNRPRQISTHGHIRQVL